MAEQSVEVANVYLRDTTGLLLDEAVKLRKPSSKSLTCPISASKKGSSMQLA